MIAPQEARRAKRTGGGCCPEISGGTAMTRQEARRASRHTGGGCCPIRSGGGSCPPPRVLEAPRVVQETAGDFFSPCCAIGSVVEAEETISARGSIGRAFGGEPNECAADDACSRLLGDGDMGSEGDSNGGDPLSGRGGSFGDGCPCTMSAVLPPVALLLPLTSPGLCLPVECTGALRRGGL